MFCKWIGSFCSYSDTGAAFKPLYNSRSTEGQKEILSNYYNGLQKLFAGNLTHYTVCSGNALKSTDDFPICKGRTSSHVKLLSLQPEHESEFLNLPIPNCTSFRPFEIQSSPPHSPRFDTLPLGSLAPMHKRTHADTIRQPSQVSDSSPLVGYREVYGKKVSSDLD
eukprot:TRINITY_DN479_c0_g1_i1.p2 TRINITY_DN479_c0_g1~~TRINITY_DN479_c0_g1_i1.p2  ORF type:complete len:166 (+),score=18.29 TRINITY_DN479_c0_g1_i1:706-1203(+)